MRKTGLYILFIIILLCGCADKNTRLDYEEDNGKLTQVDTENESIIIISEYESTTMAAEPMTESSQMESETSEITMIPDGMSVSSAMKKVLLGESELKAVNPDGTGSTEIMLFDELKEYFEVPHEYYEFWIQDVDADGVDEVGLNIYDYTFLLHQTGEDVYAYKINGKAVQFVYDDGGKAVYYDYSENQDGTEISEEEYNNLVKNYSSEQVNCIPYTEENLQKLTTQEEKR